MQELQRPSLSLNRGSDPITLFVEELQNAIDTGDANRFNRYFAQDVFWASPLGAVAVGYDQIHAIHLQMFASVVPVKGTAQYVVEHARFPAEDVAIAYVRSLSKHSSEPFEPPLPALPGTFDELALLVLVRRDGKWWLAAAQHVPDRRDVYAKP